MVLQVDPFEERSNKEGPMDTPGGGTHLGLLKKSQTYTHDMMK